MRNEMRVNEARYSDAYLDEVIGCVIERINNFDDLKEYTYFFMSQP